MNNYRYDHRFYNPVMNIIMDEIDSLDNIKTRVEDDIPKGIWKSNGKSTEDWAKYAHSNNLWYPTTVYKDDEPYCYIVNGEEYIEVYFLDERLFEYIYMAYKKMDEEKMFLSKVYIREYLYKEKKALADLKKDKKMVFSPKGKLTVTTENIIREPSVKIEREIEEAAHPVNVSQNWKNIPKYDHYEDILNYEDIIKPGDLLKGVDTSALAPEAESNDIDPDNGTKNNRWLPPDWNKN